MPLLDLERAYNTTADKKKTSLRFSTVVATSFNCASRYQLLPIQIVPYVVLSLLSG